MKRIIRKILLFLMIAFAVVSCSPKENDSSKDPSSKQTEDKKELRTVKDMQGTEVQVPKEIKKVVITSWGDPFGIMITLGEEEKIVGMCDTSRYYWIQHQYPRFKKDVKDFGAFEKVNIEEIAAAEPDIIFAPASSKQANKKMRELGLPVYVTKVEDTNEYYEKELTALAGLFKKEDRAKKILDENHKLVELVKERVKDIPEKDKKRFFMMRKTILEKHNNDWSSGQTGEMAGGINVARDTDKGFNMTYEQLVKWDPEYIFQVLPVENNENYYEELKKDDRYKELKAIKSGNVYALPLGVHFWFEGSDKGLGTLFMAKIMYPEKFKDISVKETAKKFYKEVMGIELNDESYNIMLRAFKGSKPVGDL